MVERPLFPFRLRHVALTFLVLLGNDPISTPPIMEIEPITQIEYVITTPTPTPTRISTLEPTPSQTPTVTSTVTATKTPTRTRTVTPRPKLTPTAISTVASENCNLDSEINAQATIVLKPDETRFCSVKNPGGPFSIFFEPYNSIRVEIFEDNKATTPFNRIDQNTKESKIKPGAIYMTIESNWSFGYSHPLKIKNLGKQAINVNMSIGDLTDPGKKESHCIKIVERMPSMPDSDFTYQWKCFK